jgi:hypothetical protein
MRKKYSFWHHPLMLAAGYPKAPIPFHLANNITCLCVSPLSFHMNILLYKHGQSALDTSRTLFLLASTQCASCRLVMNHLIYVFVRWCIYLTTYDWIKSFLKITIERRAIYGNLENKINTLSMNIKTKANLSRTQVNLA